MALEPIHAGALRPWVEHLQCECTVLDLINHGLESVRRMSDLAATEALEKQGQTLMKWSQL